MGRKKKKAEDKFDSGKYYIKNKKALNDKKRSRYQTDPDYRDKIRTASKMQKKFDFETNPETTVTSKVFDGISHKVYTITGVALFCQVLPQTLRHYENRGWIPRPSFDYRTRYYTNYQKNLIVKFCRKLSANGFKKVDNYARTLEKNWSVT